jgi:hypothetical protein
MNWIRKVRRSAALAVVTVGAVTAVGVGFAASPAQAMPNDGSAICGHLLNRADYYVGLALMFPEGSWYYDYYLGLSEPYIDSFIAAGC